LDSKNEGAWANLQKLQRIDWFLGSFSIFAFFWCFDIKIFLITLLSLCTLFHFVPIECEAVTKCREHWLNGRFTQNSLAPHFRKVLTAFKGKLYPTGLNLGPRFLPL
jgi:hypothetical protein